MNKQEIFDKISTHLIKQGVQAIHNNTCLYYDEETGHKCAIGCLIPTELYDYDIEGNSVEELYRFPKFKEFLKDYDFELLEDLQHAHDVGTNQEIMLDNLHEVAIKYKLRFTERLKNESY